MSDHIESISSLYHLSSGDLSHMLASILVFGFVLYVVVDAIKNKE
jgi:hypothetical protein